MSPATRRAAEHFAVKLAGGVCSPIDNRLPVEQHVFDADGFFGRPLQRRAVDHRIGVEDDDVGREALL